MVYAFFVACQMFPAMLARSNIIRIFLVMGSGVLNG